MGVTFAYLGMWLIVSYTRGVLHLNMRVGFARVRIFVSGYVPPSRNFRLGGVLSPLLIAPCCRFLILRYTQTDSVVLIG